MLSANPLYHFKCLRVILLTYKQFNKKIGETMNTATQHNNQQLTTLRITIVAALGGLLFGYDTGVIAGSQLYFTEYFEFSPAEQGWAVSSALYGCLIGALLGGYLTKQISRKYTLICRLCCSPFQLGAQVLLTTLAS